MLPAGMERPLKVFSGRSNPALARSIAEALDLPLGKSTTQRFANDNLFVRFEESLREADVFIVQSLTPPVQDHLFELLMMIDAAKGASAHRVTAQRQEGRAPDLHRRPADRRPDRDRGGRPGAYHDPALAPGARVFQDPPRPPLGGDGDREPLRHPAGGARGGGGGGHRRRRYQARERGGQKALAAARLHREGADHRHPGGGPSSRRSGSPTPRWRPGAWSARCAGRSP